MIPVYQTVFNGVTGDCLAAAIASIFELRLTDVPNFMRFKSCWADEYVKFLGKYDLYPVQFKADKYDPLSEDEEFKLRGYHLVIVKSLRGDYNHTLVGLNGKAIFDPYPGGNYESYKEIVSYEVFISKFEHSDFGFAFIQNHNDEGSINALER